MYLSALRFIQKRTSCFHQATASRHEDEIFTHRERIRILPHNSNPIHIINMHSLHPYHRRALPTTHAGQEQHAIGTHQASSPSHGTRSGTWWAHMAAALGPGVCCRGVHTVVARRCGDSGAAMRVLVRGQAPKLTHGNPRSPFSVHSVVKGSLPKSRCLGTHSEQRSELMGEGRGGAKKRERQRS